MGPKCSTLVTRRILALGSVFGTPKSRCCLAAGRFRNKCGLSKTWFAAFLAVAARRGFDRLLLRVEVEEEDEESDESWYPEDAESAENAVL